MTATKQARTPARTSRVIFDAKWREATDSGRTFFACGGNIYSTASGEEVGASEVVAACNAHDQLVADKAALVRALRETTRQLDDAKSTMIELGGEMPSACDDALDIARAALAAAGERT